MKLPFRKSLGKTATPPRKPLSLQPWPELLTCPLRGGRARPGTRRSQPLPGRGRALPGCPLGTLPASLHTTEHPARCPSRRSLPSLYPLPVACVGGRLPPVHSHSPVQLTQTVQLASIMGATFSQHPQQGCRMPWSPARVPQPLDSAKEGGVLCSEG